MLTKIYIYVSERERERQIWGFTYHLNRRRGGGERALVGKQVTFRKDKWALR